jgi:hypothetical protein
VIDEFELDEATLRRIAKMYRQQRNPYDIAAVLKRPFVTGHVVNKLCRSPEVTRYFREVDEELSIEAAEARVKRIESAGTVENAYLALEAASKRAVDLLIAIVDAADPTEPTTQAVTACLQIMERAGITANEVHKRALQTEREKAVAWLIDNAREVMPTEYWVALMDRARVSEAVFYRMSDYGRADLLRKELAEMRRVWAEEQEEQRARN